MARSGAKTKVGSDGNSVRTSAVSANANVDDDAMICLSVALESKKETADPTTTNTHASSIRLMCFAKRVPLTHCRFHVKTFVRIAKQQVRVFR